MESVLKLKQITIMRYLYAIATLLTGVFWLISLKSEYAILFAICVFIAIFDSLTNIIKNQENGKL